MKTLKIEICEVTWHDPITGLPLEPGKSISKMVHFMTWEANWDERYNKDFAEKIANDVHAHSPEANYWAAYDGDELILEGWI